MSIANQRGRNELSRSKLVMAVVGLLATITAAMLVTDLGLLKRPEDPSKTEAGSQTSLGPQIDIQSDGPLLDGEMITLEEAKHRSPYKLPIPPTNEKTGDRAGIWIDVTAQIAFVWRTDLRFYVGRTEVTEQEAAAEWSEKAATETDTPWVITTARGHAAIGAEKSAERPSSLTFIEDGLSIQFVSPSHNLEELRQFAEEIKREE